MEVKIREANFEDYNEIKILMNQVHNLHCQNRPDIYVDTNEPLKKEEFKEIVNNSNKIVLLAECQDKVVALSIITIKEPSENPILVSRKVAYMEDLCVHKDYKRRGIGKMVYNEALKRIKLLDIDSLELMVWSFNKSAIKFYENMGMKPQYLKMEMKID
ncbi:GNAT family N-acetyltransferase [Iocasia frigidifontis]|uniref:GNAT family N-acetyltransferase n=1 Tax=Iocasia fonsfrigidae TaxID=2682810 RepID=A0A8A7KJ05_9FIRM|nr:GNAT family N-acetyltransferase [Iocasia fonsfrigidae]QTL97862.1 GNAT family N-acetyltransferase [Iocasia fonsfrigidae]